MMEERVSQNFYKPYIIIEIYLSRFTNKIIKNMVVIRSVHVGEAKAQEIIKTFDRCQTVNEVKCFF